MSLPRSRYREIVGDVRSTKWRPGGWPPWLVSLGLFYFKRCAPSVQWTLAIRLPIWLNVVHLTMKLTYPSGRLWTFSTVTDSCRPVSKWYRTSSEITTKIPYSKSILTRFSIGRNSVLTWKSYPGNHPHHPLLYWSFPGNQAITVDLLRLICIMMVTNSIMQIISSNYVVNNRDYLESQTFIMVIISRKSSYCSRPPSTHLHNDGHRFHHANHFQ